MGYKDPERRREHNRRYNEKTKHVHAAARKATRAQRRQDGKDFLRQAKDVPCVDCDKRYPYYVMDFHHRDPTEKEGLLSYVVHSGWSVERLAKEVEKCDVLCANCHREREYGSLA